MKELTVYITEKLDINKVNLNDKFPVDKNSKEIIKFLKAQGFKELDDNKIEDWDDYFVEMNKISTKVYSLTPANDDDNVDSLKFANTTEARIGNNNPIFHIMHDLITKKFRYQLCYKYGRSQDVSKNIFLKNIEQCFGWEV